MYIHKYIYIYIYICIYNTYMLPTPFVGAPRPGGDTWIPFVKHSRCFKVPKLAVRSIVNRI